MTTTTHARLLVEFEGNDGETVHFALFVGDCRSITEEQQDDLMALCKNIYEANHGDLNEGVEATVEPEKEKPSPVAGAAKKARK